MIGGTIIFLNLNLKTVNNIHRILVINRAYAYFYLPKILSMNF